MLCPGSLNAEKDLPVTTSVYAEKGTMLHDRVNKLINGHKDWKKDLPEDLQEITKKAQEYFYSVKLDKETIIDLHEKRFNLNFLTPPFEDMGGTVDSMVLCYNKKDKTYELHVIDYKFGMGVKVEAYENYQLMLYLLGALNDFNFLKILEDNIPKFKITSIHKYLKVFLHIAQPYLSDSCWELREDELKSLLYGKRLNLIKNVIDNAYSEEAVRIPSKKACQFCRAKATCSSLADIVPKIDNIKDKETILARIRLLSDAEISNIYDKKDVIILYLNSIEEYIKNRLSEGSFADYELQDRLSNRKWTDTAEEQLIKLLGDSAYETTKKLISITKAEKLLDKKDIINLTTKEVIDKKIVKQNYFIEDLLTD
jgi:hypothetical protein